MSNHTTSPPFLFGKITRIDVTNEGDGYFVTFEDGRRRYVSKIELGIIEFRLNRYVKIIYKDKEMKP